MYRLACRHLGYYDGENDAFWYRDGSLDLSIRVLFEGKKEALEFEQQLQDERLVVNSPLYNVQFDLELQSTHLSVGSKHELSSTSSNH